MACSNYIPLMWQYRIAKLPLFADRVCLSVYLITRYKALNVPTDLPLGALAFWPAKSHARLSKIHAYLLQNDALYSALVKESQTRSQRATRFAQSQTAIPTTHNIGA